MAGVGGRHRGGSRRPARPAPDRDPGPPAREHVHPRGRAGARRRRSRDARQGAAPGARQAPAQRRAPHEGHPHGRRHPLPSRPLRRGRPAAEAGRGPPHPRLVQHLVRPRARRRARGRRPQRRRGTGRADPPSRGRPRTTPWGGEAPRPPLRMRLKYRMARRWFAPPRPTIRVEDAETVRLARRDGSPSTRPATPATTSACSTRRRHPALRRPRPADDHAAHRRAAGRRGSPGPVLRLPRADAPPRRRQDRPARPTASRSTTSTGASRPSASTTSTG